MGGFGSGRREYATTPTVGECRHLAADNFTDLLDAEDGRVATVKWDETTNIRAVMINRDGDEYVDALRLTYTAAPDTDNATQYSYTVPVTYTTPNFGGRRPWFECPECDTRRGKLYLPPRGEVFACRECYDLGYRTARASGDDVEQATLRYKRAFQKADARDRRPHPNSLVSPERPKGMHHDTFDDLTDAVADAREEFHRTFNHEIRRRLRELNGLVE